MQAFSPMKDHLNKLSDDLIVHVLSFLDSDQLRGICTVCKRWSGILRSRPELWREVHIVLRPKIRRGRDRRNSYTIPCQLDVDRIAAWLAHRQQHLQRLTLELEYPDAMLAMPQLLPQLAPALQHLELLGAASTNWVYLQADWHWLRSMTRLQRLVFEDVLLELHPLRLPTSLTALHIDRVGEGGEELSGWDELPHGFSKLTALRQLTVGTAIAYVSHYDDMEDAEEVFAPLAGFGLLEQLALPCSPLAAVPAVVTRLAASLTLLDLSGCNPEEHLGSGWREGAFDHLSALTNLRHLDLTYCGLGSLPRAVCMLPAMRTLLLGHNRLTTACPAGNEDECAKPEGGGTVNGAPAPYLHQLCHLELQHNPVMPLPVQAVQQCSTLTWLNLTASSRAGEGWEQLLRALPAGCRCKHSSPQAATGWLPGDAAAAGGAAGPGERRNQPLLEYAPVQQQLVPASSLLGLTEVCAAASHGIVLQ